MAIAGRTRLVARRADRQNPGRRQRAPTSPATQKPYELVLSPPARRPISDVLPDADAVAVVVNHFVTTTVLDNAQRIGMPLRDDLSGVWSARRGT
jgi:mRNA interferase RelE/StbE